MPQFLLDTHALLWWWDNDPRLSEIARAAIMAESSAIFVSSVSALELAIKVRIGKLPQFSSNVASYDMDIAAEGFQHLNVTASHGLHAGMLPGEHRDPFDRVLAAQALAENLTVITRDRAFTGFGCQVLW